MTDAERILHDVLVRAWGQMLGLTPLRALHEKGQSAALESIRAQSEKNLRWMLGEPDTAAWLGAPAGGVPEAEIAKSSAESAQGSLRRALTAIRAGELVFTHSCADGAATDCCRAVTMLRPDGCRSEIGQDKVALADVMERGLDSVMSESRERVWRKLSNKSLPNRIEWLHRECPPRDGGPIPGFTLDLERVRRLDEVRQSIVHGIGVEAAAGLEDPEATFLCLTSMYLGRLVMSHYNIALDSTYTARALGTGP